MPTLVDVNEARHSAGEGLLDLELTVLLDGVQTEMPYTYDPAEQYSLNWEITAWLMANPDFPVGEYVPPPEPSLLEEPLTRRQVRAALALAGFPRTAVPDAIELIPDATQRDLAMIDWEDAPFYNRAHPLFNDTSLLAALGLNGAMIDAMWISAHGLPA